MAPAAPLPRLITSIPPGPRQNKRTLLVLGTVVALAGVGGIALKFGGQRPGPQSRATRPARGRDGDHREPHDPARRLAPALDVCAGQALPPAPAPDPTPTVPREPTPRRPARRLSAVEQWRMPSRRGRSPYRPRRPRRDARTSRRPSRCSARRHQPATVAPKEAPKRWFSRETPMQGDILTPPFPEEKDAEGRGRQSTLFPQAIWETPADPTKVLYADQVVQGLLMQSLNSDIPGTVRVKATETVYDRFWQGKVLIPMDTTFLGRQEGQAAVWAGTRARDDHDGHPARWHRDPVEEWAGRGCGRRDRDSRQGEQPLRVGHSWRRALRVAQHWHAGALWEHVELPAESPPGVCPGYGTEPRAERARHGEPRTQRQPQP